jgi:mono/diheme cytochrome c family protein
MRTVIVVVLLCWSSLAYAQWSLIPRSAATEKSPLSATPAVLKRGRALYEVHCAKCHGPTGKGDGPDKTYDLAHPAADLTREFRARFNPDGVLFYKIWNGRIQPAMPAYKDTVRRDDVWAIVEYIKTLRKPER